MNVTSLRPWGMALATLTATGLVLFAHPQIALAQQDRSFNPQVVHPAPGPDEFITVESAVPLRHKSYGLGLALNWSRDEFSILTYDTIKRSTTTVRANLIENALGADVWAAFGLFNRFQ